MEEINDRVAYQVLAAALSSDDALEYFYRNLPPNLLLEFGKGHGEIYASLLRFYEKTGLTRLDKQGYIHWLESQYPQVLLAVGGSEGLDEYIKQAEGLEVSDPTVVTALIKSAVNARKQTENIEKLTNIISSSPNPGLYSDDVERLATSILDLNRNTIDPLRGIYDARKISDEADHLWDLPDFMPTQFTSLNEAIGYDKNAGFVRGAVHAILARSGLGKSTFAKSLMNNWLDQGLTCLYINYEETRPHWERVLFTQVTRQNIYRGAEVDEETRKRHTQTFREKMAEWDGRLLVKHDPETFFYEDMERWVREVAKAGTNLDVLFIDTIQSLFLKASGGGPRWGQFEEMIVRIEKLAKDLNCAIVITAQENANRLREKREVVQQNDIGGSLAIAQKCTVAVFITEAKLNFGDDSIDDTIMQLQIPKNRITGVTTSSNAPLVKYNDDSKSYEPFEIAPADLNSENGVGGLLSALESFKPY